METKKATSKIKTVVKTKPFTNNYGTTIYHDLLMENGDKIQIGKKNEQKVGWELSYEIVDEGQEYNKAKSIKPEDVPSASVVSDLKNSNTKTQDVQKLIVAQMAYKGAIELMANEPLDLEQIDKTAKHIFEGVFKLGGQNGNA